MLCLSSILCTIFFPDESFRYNFAINCEGIGNACKATLVGAANLRQGRPALNVAVKFVFADSKEFSKYITITILYSYFLVVFRLRFVGRQVTGPLALTKQLQRGSLAYFRKNKLVAQASGKRTVGDAARRHGQR